VTVQQGRLLAVSTGKTMANFYFDAVASGIGSVDKIIHNGTQFIRMVLRRPKPVTAYTGSATRTTATRFIDASYTPSSSSNIRNITVGFGSKLVTTKVIKILSTAAIDTTTVGWTVFTSLTDIEGEYINNSFKAAVASVGQAIVSTPAGNQFQYTVNVSSPPIDTTGNGLPYWRITHTGTTAFDNVTEVQIVPPLTPTMSYFDTNGNFSSSVPFEKSNILDVCYDVPNSTFYTIRYNDGTIGTATVTLNDTFSDVDAGTASGTSGFNPSRWTASNVNTQFLRVANKLSYNVSSGKGQINTTFSVANNVDINLDVVPTTLTSKKMWVTIRGLDSNNNTRFSEGVGYDTVSASGVWFATHLSNLVNSTAASQIKEIRPLWHNTASGTDSFTVVFTGGSTWTVSGTLTGALTSATTGVAYTETVSATSPITFLISSTAAPNIGEQFTFDLFTDNKKKNVTTTGIIGFTRTGSNYTTKQVITSPQTAVTTPVTVELFGNTDALVNISADNFNVITGSGTFPSVAVFTVEKVNAAGNVVNPPLISSFDIIGDPSLTYNDFLDGRVQIASTTSGTGGGFIYLKVNNALYSYANNVSLGTETGGSAVATSLAQINKDGISSFAWTHRSTALGIPFLTYLEYDAGLDMLHCKTLDKTTLLSTTSTRQVFLNISDYSTNAYKVFYDQNDFNTLYYVDSTKILRAWNLNDTISAFMAVNAETITLPAGTAQNTNVNADVINAWGEVLSGKVVTFAVTAGDGALTPSTDATDVVGRATTQYTVGSTVGVSTVTATVTET